MVVRDLPGGPARDRRRSAPGGRRYNELASLYTRQHLAGRGRGHRPGPPAGGAWRPWGDLSRRSGQHPGADLPGRGRVPAPVLGAGARGTAGRRHPLRGVPGEAGSSPSSSPTRSGKPFPSASSSARRRAPRGVLAVKNLATRESREYPSAREAAADLAGQDRLQPSAGASVYIRAESTRRASPRRCPGPRRSRRRWRCLSRCGHAPELAAVEYRSGPRPADPRGASAFSEQLAVFGRRLRDEDGVKDVAALHVLHDQSRETYWTPTPETWTRNDRGKETWVGRHRALPGWTPGRRCPGPLPGGPGGPGGGLGRGVVRHRSRTEIGNGGGVSRRSGGPGIFGVGGLQVCAHGAALPGRLRGPATGPWTRRGSTGNSWTGCTARPPGGTGSREPGRVRVRRGEEPGEYISWTMEPDSPERGIPPDQIESPELHAGASPGSVGNPMTALRRGIRSYALRAGRMTDLQRTSYETLAAAHGAFPSGPGSPSIPEAAFGRTAPWYWRSASGWGWPPPRSRRALPGHGLPGHRGAYPRGRQAPLGDRETGPGRTSVSCTTTRSNSSSPASVPVPCRGSTCSSRIPGPRSVTTSAA
ncbi:MAG: hypothetical protein MZU95_08660 [Desulfomicrobium escambiense]|nr:hypothetical protein [Desulfomicrobium escambiense]